MDWPLPDAVRQAKRQVSDDLRSDPYLPYILLLSFVLASFWVWHRLPNFATRDERWRVVDPVEVLAAYLDDPALGSVTEGVAYWRTYGAAMYLSAVALVPTLILVLASGSLSGFAAMGRHLDVSFWEHWLRTPGWIWTASVLPARLANVALAVGSVYVLYRLGTTVRDRATGRLAALLFSLTWGLVILSHEAGEDVPSLFFFLLSFYFAVRYVDAGQRRLFYWGCLFGGASIAFKLSGGVSAVVLGVALLQRARREDWPRSLVRPQVVAGGLLVAVAAIAVGYPTIAFGAPSEFGGRISRAFSAKSDPHGWLVKPNWWWILRGYLHGLGLPLALGTVGGVVAALPRLRDRSLTADALALALVAVGSFLAVFSTWEYIRTHHLFPTFSLLVFVLAVGLARLREREARVGRVVIAALVLTSAIYAGVGALGYASQPRDQAVSWFEINAADNASVETYANDPQDAAVPHWADAEYVPRSGMAGVRERCPEYIVLNYHTAILTLAPDSHSARADILNSRNAELYVRDLLGEDTYPYAVAGEFGPRPRFLDGEPRRPTWWRLLRVGLVPRTIQYGDPQDMGVNQYTVVLERSGEC
jgi:hypothetical protein